MFGIGLHELIVIFVIALLVFGPKRLPEVAKALGRGIREFKRASQEIKESIELESTAESLKRDIEASLENTKQGKTSKNEEEHGR